MDAKASGEADHQPSLGKATEFGYSVFEPNSVPGAQQCSRGTVRVEKPRQRFSAFGFSTNFTSSVPVAFTTSSLVADSYPAFMTSMVRAPVSSSAR